MTLIQESYLQSLLRECDADFGRQQKQAIQTVNSRLAQIYKILKKNTKYAFSNFSLQVIVRFMEFAVQVNEKFVYAEQFVELFFQRVTAPSQYYIRALLVQALCITYRGHKVQHKGEAMINIIKGSLQQISKALNIIASPPDPNSKGKDSKGGGGGDPNKARYSFLVYNASTCLYKITRFMLRQHWQKNFADIYQRIYKLFEQLDEPDQNWRCRFTLVLFQCLYDNEKKPDAFKILDLLWDRAKNKGCDILDSLFRLRVHLSKENGALAGIIKKDIEGADPNGWKILEVLQRMKSGAIPDAQIQKQLMGVINQISLGVLSNNQQTASVTLSHVMQQRLAQAGRIALKFNIISIASSITNFLAKVRQPNQKAMVLNEYNKAELQIKKKNQFIDKKTGMIMSFSQIKQLEILNRKQALKTLEKVMLINKKLNHSDLIYQGAILIWNISLPFMTQEYQLYIVKAMDISVQLLEQIDSVDHDLRTKMHLQLAKIYFGNEQMFHQVQRNIMKAIKLDHSIPVNRLQFKFDPEEDPSLYHRPYQRYLTAYREKILLKTMQNLDPHQLDKVVSDLWNVAQQKSETARIDTLQKCMRTLLTLQEEKFIVDESQILVEQQIKEQKILFEQKKLRIYKKKKLLAGELAEQSFEWELNDFTKKASQFVLEDTWEGKNSIEMIIAQVKCLYFLGQIFIDEIIQDNYEAPFTQPIEYQYQEQKAELSQEQKKQLENRKKLAFQKFRKGIELSQSIQQHWLIFNGSIYVWNNFLHIFKSSANDSKLHPEFINLLKKLFESMKNSLKEIQSKNIVYYDLGTKIQAFTNIGLTYARIMEGQKQPDQVLKVCEALLATQLQPNTRKLTNSMKARVMSGKGGVVGGKDQKKGGKDAPQQKTTGYNDTFLFQIFTQLEVIQNSTNKGQAENLIKKCMETLQTWKPKDNDQMELQLNAELWARLARLAVNQQTTQMFKIAIKCSNHSLSLTQTNRTTSSIPSNRLRWYSLSQFLYAQSLLKIANPETQDTDSYQKLMFASLNHAVEAASKGQRASISALVVDGAKQVWNICCKLQGNQRNRSKLLYPLKSTLSFLIQSRQDNEPDLILLLAHLFFKAANENNQSKIGEQIADSLFPLVPKNLQKSIWEAKMVFMSKQGKNQLQAISNMKEADPSLQAKLWVKLARISNNTKKQFAAYNKAIDILKKQNSIQIVQILIEYAEWQLRIGNQKVKNVTSTLLLASDYLIDIQFGEDDEEDEDENQEDRGTVFSRSTRGKKSHGSKSIKSSVKGSKITKKNVEKKGSNYKNSSNVSRMNRSGRAAKVNKSKNTKSIFSHRQQDPNPESLNCIHFERLFRIHTILATITETPSNRIRYALDAKHFLLKILDISFNTLNTIQENAAKFADKNSQNQKPIEKFKIPITVKEWARFEIPKQFSDKIKILQDPNFMGTYAFQKPQLTFSYIRTACKILKNYGLDAHTLPIIFFERYISQYIIENPNFLEVANLQMSLCLNKIGYKDPENPSVSRPSSSKYRMTQLQKNQQNVKSKSKIVDNKNENQIFQSIRPNLIKPMATYQAWFEIGKLLIQFGEIQPAKAYITESLQHFKILSDFQATGQAYIYLLMIALYEGQSQQAMEYGLMANKFCKSILNWSSLLLSSSKLLIFLNKYNDLTNFASRVYQVVDEIINNLNQNNEQKHIYESEIIDLKDVLILIELIDLNLRFNESVQQQMHNCNVLISNSIMQLEKRLEKDKIWKLQHYSYFYDIAYTILHFFIFGKDKEYHISQTVFLKMFGLLSKIESSLFQLMKYTLVGTSSEFTSNSLIHLYRKYRFLKAEGFSFEESIGQYVALNEENQMDNDNQEKNEDKVIKKYLDTLNIQIHKSKSSGPLSLSPAQSSLSILANLKPNINNQSCQYLNWLVANARALTFKAKSEGSLRNVWKNINYESQQSFEQKKQQDIDQKKIDNELESAAISLQAFYDIVDKNYEEKLLNFQQNTKCFGLGQKFYQAFVENTGQQMSEKAFECLCKMQHCSYSQTIISTLQKNLNNSHKFNSICRILESTRVNQEQMREILQKNKIFSAFLKVPKYDECLNLIPRNGIYIVLQLSNDKSQIYCGCLVNEKVDQQFLPRYIMKKKSIDKIQLDTYRKLHLKISKIKREVSFLAYDDEQKLKKLLTQTEEELQRIVQKLNKLSQWWLLDLINIINTVKEGLPVQEVDKNKKGAKDAKKKGGKDDVGAYESPLGATPGGFQSITFILGELFSGLPFDSMKGLQVVPSISYNQSIFYLSRKMQVLGYKPDVNNSNGFGADKGKYIAYDFKEPSLNFKQLASNIVKENPGLKIDGLSSNVRIPAIGDYNKYLGEPGFLQVYGSIDFINYIKIPLLLENVGNTKCKLVIITDKLNYRKSFLNKFLSLDQKGHSNSIEQQQNVLNVVSDLLDINLIKSRWTTSIQTDKNILNKLYKNLGAGNYIGAVNFKGSSEGEESTYNRLHQRISVSIYGCPILRL